jgi:ribonuclease P protein component
LTGPRALRIETGETNETHLSAEQSPAEENARLPRADGEPDGSTGHQATPPQGPQAAHGFDPDEAAGLSSAVGGVQRSRTRALGKDARVRKRRDFLHIQNAGRRVATRHFLVVYTRTGDAPPRLGITVTKKIGNAVVRNAIKRAVRETFRANAAAVAPGASLVVIARSGAGDLGTNAIAAEIAPAMRSIDAAPARTAQTDLARS